AKVESVNPENVPVSGGCIICANHPLGGLDGIALIHAVSRIRKDAKFLVNDILLFFKNFGDVFVAVNKTGKNSKGALTRIDDVYSSDNAVLVFPAGLVSRKQNGIIKDLEWKKSFVTKATTYKKPILPAFIEGRNTNWFYNLASFRKKIGIKANIEMFYLADEMFNQRGKPIRIHFGKPFSPDLLDESRSHREWAQVIKSYVYEMGKGTQLSFDEYIKTLPPGRR
ncbi:MAG: 1-acyl-sn-glycerol-3-phosphate acyltransferase, partial [Bacteroidia bacterium]